MYKRVVFFSFFSDIVTIITVSINFFFFEFCEIFIFLSLLLAFFLLHACQFRRTKKDKQIRVFTATASNNVCMCLL